MCNVAIIRSYDLLTGQDTKGSGRGVFQKHCSGINLKTPETSHTVNYSRAVRADTTEVIPKSSSVGLHILRVRPGHNQPT